jgi:hypothetical protein
MPRALLAGVAILAVCGLFGCDDDEPTRRSPHSTVIDAARGNYRGIAVGDPEAKVRRLFGTPRPRRPGQCDLCPAGPAAADELGVPTVIDSPAGEPGGLRYRNVVFTTARGRIHGFVVTDPSAATSRGVGIGDPIDRAGNRYRELRCGIANLNTEYRPFRFCTGRLGRLFVSFGADPIRSITVSSTRLTG